MQQESRGFSGQHSYGLLSLQIQHRQIEDVDGEHEQADPAHRLEQARLRTIQQANDGDAGHHDGRLDRNQVHRRNVGKERALKVSQIVHSDNHQIEQVAPQQVADGHVQRPDSQCRKSDRNFRQGGG